MLTVHLRDSAEPVVWSSDAPLPGGGVWFDLCDATDAERHAVQAATGLQLPIRDDIGGIGLAGRNRQSSHAIYLQVPRYADAMDPARHATPLSLILSARHLVTQRCARSETFEIAARQWQVDQRVDGASAAFAELLETMSERTAASMQAVAADVAELSDAVFVGNRVRTAQLRRWLMHVGHLEARLARNRGSLLGITRVVGFICDRTLDWLPAAQRTRIATVRSDLAALDEFDGELTDKLQFLLDAIFGLISVDQNNVMKVFTVWALAAVPPVLLAGIWGMNFKYMPELAWPWGYGFALGCMLVSVLIPLAIFKWRGWLSND